MVTTRTSTPPSVGETRTNMTEPAPGSKLQARLWIGRNPIPFMLGCLLVGYWIGMSSTRSKGWDPG